MKVHLRQRLQKKSKKISLFLEYYKGASIDSKGRKTYKRDYEYLDLFLHIKPKTTIEKQENKQNLELAKNIKSKRELEIKNNEYGFLKNQNLILTLFHTSKNLQKKDLLR